jgi:hypothetical protein
VLAPIALLADLGAVVGWLSGGALAAALGSILAAVVAGVWGAVVGTDGVLGRRGKKMGKSIVGDWLVEIWMGWRVLLFAVGWSTELGG